MKKVAILFTVFVLLITLVACDPSNATQEEIMKRVSDKPYEELITKVYTTEEMSEYLKYYDELEWEDRIIHSATYEEIAEAYDDEDCVEKYPTAVIYSEGKCIIDQIQQENVITSINKAFPIQCLRNNNGTYYSIHRFDDKYLLYTIYLQDIKNGIIFKDPRYNIVLPVDTTLTDEAISAIQEGGSLADVIKIDPSAEKVFDPWDCYLREDIEWGMSAKPRPQIQIVFTSIHYTKEGNWYRIQYEFMDPLYDEKGKEIKAEYEVVNQETIQHFVIVQSIESIEPPILEQDLPK
ncbi:MAG: hypothetical protein IKK58_01380 [Clostridia bacterium]|nr:hypothetical protein [Clostridia bacterium]